MFRSPIIDVVVRKFFVIEKLIKQFPQVVVVRRFEEIQSSDVSQVRGEFFRIAFAQDFNRSGSLCVPDLLVPLFQGLGLQSLPAKKSES